MGGGFAVANIKVLLPLYQAATDRFWDQIQGPPIQIWDMVTVNQQVNSSSNADFDFSCSSAATFFELILLKASQP